MQTALIYTRVSSDEQAKDGVSLDAQLAECRRYAARQGWALGQEYQDVLPGTRDDRPQYQRLLADARALRAQGKAIAVVVAALDRLGRKLIERVRSREELKALGVPVHSAREGGEVSDLVANVLAAVAQEEVRRLGERISASRQHIANLGWCKSGKTPWGYRWRPATEAERAQGAPRSVLEVNPAEAPFVAELFHRIAAGAPIRQAAMWAASLPESARGGRKLNYQSIKGVLHSPLYAPEAGRRWPELVPTTVYQQAQGRIDRHKVLAHQASGQYLLAGFTWCPKCGSRMNGQTGGARQQPRYSCAGSKRVGDRAGWHCTMTALRDAVDRAVLVQVGRILAFFERPDARAALERAWAALQTPADSTVAQRQRQLEQTREQAKKRLGDAAIRLIDGVIDKAGYDAARERIQADLDAAERELATLAATDAPTLDLPPLASVLGQLPSWAAVLDGDDVPAKREALVLLIDRIEPERIGHGRYDARITWTPLGEALAAAVTG